MTPLLSVVLPLFKKAFCGTDDRLRARPDGAALFSDRGGRRLHRRWSRCGGAY